MIQRIMGFHLGNMTDLRHKEGDDQ